MINLRGFSTSMIAVMLFSAAPQLVSAGAGVIAVRNVRTALRSAPVAPIVSPLGNSLLQQSNALNGTALPTLQASPLKAIATLSPRVAPTALEVTLPRQKAWSHSPTERYREEVPLANAVGARPHVVGVRPVVAKGLANTVHEISKAPNSGAQAASLLGNFFHGKRLNRAGASDPVYAERSVVQPRRWGLASDGRLRNAGDPSQQPQPAPAPEGRKGKGPRGFFKILTSLLVAGSGLYGGNFIGGIAYSLAPAGIIRAVLLSAGVTVLAYFIRRQVLRRSSGRIFFAPFLGALTFTTLSQVIWDLIGFPYVSLGAGALLAILAALYAAGIGRKKKYQ